MQTLLIEFLTVEHKNPNSLEPDSLSMVFFACIKCSQTFLKEGTNNKIVINYFSQIV